MALDTWTIEKWAELLQPGIKDTIAENERMRHEIDVLNGKIEELHKVIGTLTKSIEKLSKEG